MVAPTLYEQPIIRYKNGQWQGMDDVVAQEVPLTITWNDAQKEHQATLWTAPQNLEELAVGHVLLECCPQQQGCVFTANVTPAKTGFSAQVTMAGGQTPPIKTPPLTTSAHAPIRAEEIMEAMRLFMNAPGQWQETGCFHRAGLYCPEQKRLVHTTEDIARHNCLTRLAGWAALTHTPPAALLLLVSARFTHSLCAKALHAGFRLLVGRSAVTTAAIALANQAHAVLAGFTRPEENRLSLFADPHERVR